MAVIPPDAGVRMRTQTDPGQVQSLAPVRGIPAGLPEFQPGQSFTARIQELLPDNTYKALVAGRQLTLQLPEGASPGDLLELTVVDRTPHSVIARRAEGQPTPGQADARPYPYARISDAGRLIGQLLPAEGEAPPPAALSRGQPVLAQPPANGGQLASALRNAVSQSGLFYEAHQAQWIAGERPLNSLRAEPQGQLPAAPRPLATLDLGPASGRESRAQPAGSAGPNAAPGEPSQATRADFAPRLMEAPAGRGEAQTGAAATGSAQQHAAASVPDGIRAIVQQQLDAVATQRLAWHGDVWPGQTIDWAIQRDFVEERDAAAAEVADAPRWSTSLRLTMPRLGTVDAVVQLVGDRLRIRVAADEDAVGDLRQQTRNLTDALANAGLAVQSLEIRHEG
ncbi:MAG: flagellar hook-length control protein FliK [Rhodocyclales bacterium]|nr:flagellar hook-length control protein FliK [Rhodocyclales bacterium]